MFNHIIKKLHFMCPYTVDKMKMAVTSNNNINLRWISSRFSWLVLSSTTHCRRHTSSSLF